MVKKLRTQTFFWLKVSTASLGQIGRLEGILKLILRGLVLCQRKLIKRGLATGTGAEMRPTTVSGIVTGDAPVSYWSIFFLCP